VSLIKYEPFNFFSEQAKQPYFWKNIENTIKKESGMIVRTCRKRQILNPCTLENIDYQLDPYIGCEHYCYYCYALNQAETDWSKEVLIHKDITSMLESELAGIPPQTIYI
jgi:DNA repair photolyase